MTIDAEIDGLNLQLSWDDMPLRPELEQAIRERFRKEAAELLGRLVNEEAGKYMRETRLTPYVPLGGKTKVIVKMTGPYDGDPRLIAGVEPSDEPEL
jgi:hypothetical protein